MLITGGILAPRDEELARAEQWLTALLASIKPAGHRHLVRAFATWDVMRRLRRTAAARRRPRTRTAHARLGRLFWQPSGYAHLSRPARSECDGS
jgi:hypothetical protein